MRRRVLKILKSIIIPILLAGTLFVFTAPAVQAQAVTPENLGLTSQVQQNIGLASTDIRVVIARIIRVALGLLGIIALVLVIYGGFVFMTAGGDDQKISQGKKILINGVIGLTIILSSYAITSFVISKLVEATGSGVGAGGGGGGGGGGGYGFNEFYVQALPPSGQYCVRNVSPAIVFNQNVTLATIFGNIVLNEKVSGATVTGTWQYGANQSTVLFVPEGSCSPSLRNDCLKSNFDYSVVFTGSSNIKAVSDSNLVLNCLRGAGCGTVDFTSGEAVDRTPPTISIFAPPKNSALEIGITQPFKITYSDDNGVQNVSLTVANPAGGQPWVIGSVTSPTCQKTGNVVISWNTALINPNDYNVTATGIDYSGQSGTDTGLYTLRPQHCFNSVKDSDETGVNCGGATCGTCAGGTCTANSQCAGGICSGGICLTKTTIQSFSPPSGAPGTFVSIFGQYFGTTSGHVYFGKNSAPSVSSSDWVEAFPPLSCGAFSYWNNNQIIIQAPTGTAVSTPIKVVTAPRDNGSGTLAVETDLTSAHGLANFQITTTTRPGICMLIPDNGAPGDLVSVDGKNFGLISLASDGVFFDAQKALVLTSGSGLVGWTDSLISVATPGILAGHLSVHVSKNGFESNKVEYTVNPVNGGTYPTISSVAPNSGPAGQYITISGKNFGSSQGTVLFYKSPSDVAPFPLVGNLSFPSVCQANLWSDSQVIVKAPDATQSGQVYVIKVKTVDTKTSLYDTNQVFTGASGSPSPGICSISPGGGPIPLSIGQKVDIYGENFAVGSSSPYFWGINATDPGSMVGRSLAVVDGLSTNNHLIVTPNSATITGQVSVFRTTDSKMSNPVNFNVADCTVAGNTCAGGYQCCSSGGDKGSCILGTGVCADTTRFSGYLWRFSTKGIPQPPAVVERCDGTTERIVNPLLPSPSPSVQWDNNPADDSHNVCNSALVTIEFSSSLDHDTVKSSSVKVNSCDSISTTTPVNICRNPQPVVLTAASYSLQTATNNHDYLQLKATSPWLKDGIYQVSLSSTIASVKADPTDPILTLVPSKPCGDGTAYCFAFQGGGQDCQLRSVVVTPYNFLTSLLESPMQSQVDISNRAPVIYRGLGLSTQKCIMLDTSGFDWEWSSRSTAYADIFGVKTGREVKVSSLANTVGIGLTDNSVLIQAQATTSTITKTGISPLTINLSDPKVIDWWPKCFEACNNAEVGVRFNLALSTRNLVPFSPGTIQLWKCLDENCLSKQLVSFAAAPPALGVMPNIINIANMGIGPDLLAADTIYEVTVSNASTTPTTSLNNIWVRSSSTDPASFGKPFNDQFTWRFHTKKNTCAVSRVAVDPANFTALNITDRAVFGAQPFSAPDSCSVNGQKLNPWKLNWVWSSSSTSVATIESFSTRGYNPACTTGCILRGSSIPSSVTTNLTGICGNGKIEAGEDCDGPNLGAGCGLDCRFSGPPTTTRNPGSSPVFNSASSSASVCGNGLVGIGEDCDLGIAANVNVSTSSLSCSSICTHLGTKLSSKWCFDHKVDTGGFALTDYNLACTNAVSRCGDGVQSPDEDVNCDLGSVTPFTHAAFCNDFCLYNTSTVPYRKCAPNTEGCDKNGQFLGSSLSYSTSTSVCGDGVAGKGEETSCESNLIITHSALLDPWALAIGVGVGTGTGTPPAQVSVIGAVTQFGATSFSGSGKFTIPCGYEKDSDCAAYGDNFGVGADSCCYAKPTIASKTPLGPDVCLNTAIQVDFNGVINQAPLTTSSIYIARGEVGSCATGESNVTALFLSSNTEIHAETWFARLLQPIKKFFVWLFGYEAEAASPPAPDHWCVGSDSGEVTVDKTGASTSRVRVSITKPLSPNTPYTIILTDAIKNTAGVSIGRNTGNKYFSYQFNTGSTLCEITGATMTPSSWYFSSVGERVSLMAAAISSNGPIQPLPGVYDWDYDWKPTSNPYVILPASSQSSVAVTAKNQNGELDVSALVNISTNTITATTGTVASASARLTVLLCQHPWPIKKSLGPKQIFPYSDSKGNIDGFDNVGRINFDGSAIPASDAGVGDGYFNFSTYYCADNGSNLTTADDWPYLHPVVQASSSSLKIAHGSCEVTGDVCDKDADCAQTITLVNGSFEVPVISVNGGVNAASTSWQTNSINNKIKFLSNGTSDGAGNTINADSGNQLIELDANSVYQDFATVPGTTFGWELAHRGWAGTEKMQVSIGAPGGALVNQTIGGITDGKGAWGNHAGVYTVPAGQYQTRISLDSSVVGNLVDGVKLGLHSLSCFVNSPVKRFLFTNDKNSDAIGIQIFRNPKHLSPMEWYGAGRSTGGMGFGGTVQSTNIAGYRAVTDGNNIYVGGLNYSPNPANPRENNLYDVIYLFSVDTTASADTKHVFEDLIKNLHFNTNLTNNSGYCGPNITSPLYRDKCSNDLDCPANAPVCSAQISKLQRDYQRITDLKSIDVLLQSYRLQSGSYPNLTAGTYIPGQTISTWPSWSALGSAVGAALPIDPVNKLGKRGTCTFDPSTVCTFDSDCPHDTCLLHDATTGWSTANARYSFACSPSSSAYRYAYSTSTGYRVFSHFEDPGIVVSNLNNFVNGFNFSDISLFPGIYAWNNSYGICDGATVFSSNPSTCGNGIVEVGEHCDANPDPSVVVKYDKTTCTATGNATVTTCGKKTSANPCRWGAPATVTCRSLSACGNGAVEYGETCDSGAPRNDPTDCTAAYKSSAPANNCTYCVAATCQKATKTGLYCGDNVTSTAFGEVCDQGAQNGTACTPIYDNSCQYCNSTCTSLTTVPKTIWCGDGIVNGTEDCDGSNVACTSGGLDGLKYCNNSTCRWAVSGGPCEGKTGLSWTVTDDSNSNSGFKLTGNNLNGNTQVVGTGAAASVVLVFKPSPSLVQTDDSITTPSVAFPTGGFNSSGSAKSLTQVNGAGAAASVRLGSVYTASSAWVTDGNVPFYSPQGIISDSAGNIYVEDSGNGRVVKFDPSGNPILKFGSSGTGPGQLSIPTGIVLDSAGNIYVADSNNNRVEVFDSAGTYLFQIGTGASGNGDYDIVDPRGIAIDSVGNIYVSEVGNNRIHKFNYRGAYISQFGSYGTGVGQFLGPMGMVIDSADNLYVVDYKNSRVQKFNSSGRWLADIGSGYLQGPMGVALDSAGNIYVAGGKNPNIVYFDPSGSYISQFGVSGSLLGQFNLPTAVALDPAGVLYVADADNNRIQLLTPKLAGAGAYTSYFDSGIANTVWSSFSINKGSTAGVNQGSIRVRVISSASNTIVPTFSGAGNCDQSIAYDGYSPRVDISSCSGSGRYLWYKATLTLGATTLVNGPLLNAATAVPIINNYLSVGRYTSGPINVGPSVTAWGPISWTSTLTTGQGISVLVKSANNSSMTGASIWCAAANGGAAPPCLRAGDKYLQFDASLMNGSNLQLTPSLDDLTVSFSGFTLASIISKTFAYLFKILMSFL